MRFSDNKDELDLMLKGIKKIVVSSYKFGVMGKLVMLEEIKVKLAQLDKRLDELRGYL